MKSMLRRIRDKGIEYDGLAFVCPGCATIFGDGLHMLPVNTTLHSPSWDWDGNLEAPTISPSIKTEAKHRTVPFVCHSFLKVGVFDFLTDSTHSFSGKKVSIPDLPDWLVLENLKEKRNTMSPEEVTETETVTETVTETIEVPDPAQTAQDAGIEGGTDVAPAAQAANAEADANNVTPDAAPDSGLAGGTDVSQAADAANQPVGTNAPSDQPAQDAAPVPADQTAPDALAQPDVFEKVSDPNALSDQTAPDAGAGTPDPNAGQTPA